MSRLAATVFLINTFLPFIFVGLLIFIGHHVAEAYRDSIGWQIEAIDEKRAEITQKIAGLTDEIDRASGVIGTEARKVSTALARASEPFDRMGVAISKFADKVKKVPGLGKPVARSLTKIRTGLQKMFAFSTPFKKMTDALGRVRIKVDILQAELAALEVTRARMAEGAEAARHHLGQIYQVGFWAVLLIGPWLVLSYMCWVWMRVRTWRRIMVGAG